MCSTAWSRDTEVSSIEMSQSAPRPSVSAPLTGSGWLVQASYVGNRGSNLTVSTNILNAIPKKYLSTSTERDQTTIDRAQIAAFL